MATIDDKVVAMSFESSKFESGIKSAIDALDKLKASLEKLPSSGKGLDDVGASAKRVDLSHIGRSLDTIVQKLNYFSVAAIAIFTNVAMKAVQAGAQMVKGLTIDPILAGYREYATNLQSIQTILANTQAAGTNLQDVTKALDELNEYSDKTIYNFAQMARNIGTFTAAGVALEPATAAIKGIANLAALSGSSAEQASTAMYQLSQALSAGRVTLMDWNSVVNAGMGGTVFQRALAQTAEVMGTLEKGAVKLTGPMKNVTIAGESFRSSLAAKPGEESWLTSDVLTNTLKQFTSDLSDAELAAMGFSREQIKAIQLQAKTAMFAATEVKTLTQVWDVAKETAGSGWAQTWRIIFGDFVEAKTTFTALSNAINGFINVNADARNKVLQNWKDLGGRTVLINAIKTAFQNLGEIIKPIKDAFRDIFPAKTGKDLYNATLAFQNFAKSLKPSAETVENLRRTFRGVFAALDIGKQIVSGIFTVFKELFGALGGGSGGFLELTGSIGDWVVKIDEALKKGDRLHNFFVSLGQVLSAPVEMLSKLAGALGEALTAMGGGKVASGLAGITAAATPLQTVLEALSTAWSLFSDSVKESVDMEAVLESIGTAISGIGVAIGNALSSMNFDVILSAIRTGLFAALVVMFKQFLGRGSFLSQISTGFSSGILANISGLFQGLNGSMRAFQQNIRAKTLKEIALAMALLAASLLLLSLIKPEKLNAALGAMTIMFGELIGAMALLDKATKSAGFVKLPIMVASLTGLAVAIDLLTIAVMAMSRLDWNELVKGLTGVGALLAGIAVAAKPLSASSGGLIRASVAMIAIGIALNILAKAVEQFGGMSMEELAKGLGSVAISLGILAAAAKIMPTGMIVMGVGLIAVATGLKILAGAVAQFGALDWRTMGRGLAGLAGSLTAIALAMRLMPKTLVFTAAGLLLVALSLGKISSAVAKMGGMSISQIAKGLGTLAASLLILAVALHVMSGTLAGAAALAVAATGIALLAPALAMLGRQSWSQILKGMVALGGALLILGVAGVALGPVVPALLGLGAAMLLLGAGLALAGAGILAFGLGLSAIVVAGPAAVGILIAAINEFLLAIPKMATEFALGLLAIVEAFAKTAPQFVAAMVKIINSLLDVIIKSSPKLTQAIIALVDVILKVLDERQDEIIAAGFELLLALLQGLKDNIGQVTTIVIDIIVEFLQTLADNVGKIVAAGANVLVQLLKGIANNLAKVVTAAIEIVTKFITALGTGYIKIITAGATMIVKLIEGVTRNLGKVVSAGANAIINFVTGIGNNINKIINAGVNVVIKFIEGIGQNAVKLANAAGQVIVDVLNGLTAAINKYAPQIRVAAAALGFAIIDGMTLGLAGKAEDLYKKAREIADKVLEILKAPWKIFSPSKTMMELGGNIIAGMTIGLTKNSAGAYSAAAALSNGLIDVFNNTFQTNSPSKVMIEIGRWVGQGFAQGLRESKEDIQGAFAELNQRLTDAITIARQTIESEQVKLKELLSATKPDQKAISESQKVIKENEILLRRAIESRRFLRGAMKEERAELRQLSVEYENNNRQIETARELLRGLIADKKAFIESTTAQYSALPEIQTTDAEGNALTPEQQVQNYLDALAAQAQAVAVYKTTLEQLRQLGLDDATYQKLLDDGTADQEFANALLAGGRTAIEALNKLDKDLQTVSKSLATEAAKNLKDAGIEGAKGLLKGLTSQNQKIREAMNRIIDDIVEIIKSKLHIKSPSKVFEELGVYAMQGLANGFTVSTKFVADALVSTVDTALSAVKDTISRISDSINLDMNKNPIITPILDLSKVRSQAEELGALTNVSPITATASYDSAAIIAAAQTAAEATELISAGTAPTVKFEQNNYSPKALTEIEIYRQTKNQLSQIKTLLGDNLPGGSGGASIPVGVE
jgi:tape measure domain-containing protein